MSEFLGLSKVANFEAGTQADLASEGLELTEKNLQEGGFSAAVRADQGGTLTPPEFQAVDREEAVAGIPDLGLVGAQDDVSAVLTGAEARANAGGATVGHGDSVDLTNGLDHVEGFIGAKVSFMPTHPATQRQDAVLVHNGQLTGEFTQEAEGAGRGCWRAPSCAG